MPDTAKEIFAQLRCTQTGYESLSAFGALKEGEKVGTPVPLFSRIDAEKMLAQVAKKQKETSADEKRELRNIINRRSLWAKR